MIANPGSVAGQMPYGEDALIRKIQDLERQMRELGPAIQTAVGATVSGLAATVATLTTQQATLTTAVANITTLIGQQLATDAGSNVYNGAISTTTSTYASVTIAVPAGFTHATVVGISHGLFSGSPVALGLRTRIDGTDGQQAPVVTSAAWMSGSCSSTRAAYSVSGSVTVSTVCAGAASGVTGTVITSAVVLFLR